VWTNITCSASAQQTPNICRDGGFVWTGAATHLGVAHDGVADAVSIALCLRRGGLRLARRVLGLALGLRMRDFELSVCCVLVRMRTVKRTVKRNRSTFKEMGRVRLERACVSHSMSSSAPWVRSRGIYGTAAARGRATHLHLVVAEGTADGVLDVADLRSAKDTGRRRKRHSVGSAHGERACSNN